MSGSIHSDESDNYSYSFESVEEGAGEESVIAEEGHEISSSKLDEVQSLYNKADGCAATSVSQPRATSVRFREVAKTIQSMKSVSLEFKTSKEMRDQAHKEWLEHKDAMKLKETEHRKNERKKEEQKNAERKRKEAENMQKSAERMKMWEARKKSSLKDKAKKEAEGLKKREEEEKKRQEKLQEGKEAAEKWRKEKLRELAKTHRIETNKKQEEEKQKLEDVQQKEKDSKSAFSTWKKKKDALIKEHSKKLNNNERLPEQSGKSHGSQEAVKKWLTIKNKELKENKTLFTYKDASRRHAHEKAWRPARSVQYSYPKEKLPGCKHSRPPSCTTTPQSLDTTTSSNRYSNESFDSEEDEGRKDTPLSSVSDAVSDPESIHDISYPSESSSSDTDEPRVKVHAPLEGTGKLKSVQVCCQVVQYWCTCPDSNSLNTTND